MKTEITVSLEQWNRLQAEHRALREALKLAYELLDQSDARYYIGHELGELSRLHAALNAARAALATVKGA